MTPKEKARTIVAELTREECVEVMTVLMERSSPEEIYDAINMAKLSDKVKSLEGMFLRASGF